MKEWTIRIGCVLLGAVLTLGTLKFMDLVDNSTLKKEKETVLDLEIPSEEPAEEKTAEEKDEEDTKPEQNYKLEAELKFKNLIKEEKEEAVEETTSGEQPEETPSYPPNSIEAAPVRWIKDYPRINSDKTLEEKLAIRSSYDETMAVNELDKMVIANSTIDFSTMKISILGDSITEGNILPPEEQGIYDWPSQLKKILGCSEVVNLGIGGSTVSCCVDNYPMCLRWSDIPRDSDVVIVMGGSNDALFEDQWQFGNLEYDLRMNKETFCGDLDDMCSRMQWVYRDHNEAKYCKLIYINPPATVRNDEAIMYENGNILPQSRFAEAINEIAPAYSFEVIDMYNNNLLNSRDESIKSAYAPDGIHFNKDGNRILAEHVASQLIQRIEQ